MNGLIETLVAHGWTYTPARGETAAIRNPRLRQAPAEVQRFVASFEVLADPSDTCWFIPLCDYEAAETDDAAFAWNEFEKESLDAAEDAAERREIRAFWKRTLPLLLSVRGEHAYLGIVLEGDDRGRIVCGCEPMYEEAEPVCDSFEAFVRLFADCVAGKAADTPLNDFLATE